jgi:hypothetical protein
MDDQPTTTDLTTNTAGGGAARKAAETAEGVPVMLRALERVAGVHNERRAWEKGAKGERKAGRHLAKLERHGYLVLHDITVGTRGANIDHVVVGPSGVWVIDSKNVTCRKVHVWRYTLKVNGYKTRYLTAMRRQKAIASERLSAAVGFDVPVEGAIAFVGDTEVVRHKPAVDAVTGNILGIVRTLKKKPRHPDLTDRQIDQIKDAARKPETWLPGAGQADPDTTPDDTREDDDAESDVALVRWTKFGHDRVYATGPDGERLGWIDLATGNVHDVPDGRDDVTDTLHAIRDQLTADDQAASASASTPDVEPADATIGGVVTAEWKKYGKHRIYANSPAGERLGWIDVTTGHVQLEGGAGPDVAATLQQARDGL